MQNYRLNKSLVQMCLGIFLCVLFSVNATFANTTASLSINDSVVANDTLNYDSLVRADLKLRLDRSFKELAYKDSNAVNGAIVALEVLGLNAFVWAFDRYILDKDYARIGPSIWKRNLREGWEWDRNHWAINFFGHPYQGSQYYLAAREGGYGFYRSLAFAMLGSFTWEMFAETEYPAPNDFITTSIGGSMYGEVLFRLARLCWQGEKGARWYQHVSAFAFEPVGYLQRVAFGERERRMYMAPLELGLLVGFGSRFGSDYHFGGIEITEFDRDWKDRHFLGGLNLVYGKPYRKVHRPFDYFTIDLRYEQGFEGNLFEMDVKGKLVNGTVHGQGNWFDFAMYLDFDTFYGDLATIGTVSLGGGLDMAVNITPTRYFRVSTQLYWIMLGTADMAYDDLIKEVYPNYSSDKDNYQYNTGFKYVLQMELMFRNRFKISNYTAVNALSTIPGSVPHYGVEGWDILLSNFAQVDYQLTKRIGLGARYDVYFKFAAYESELFEPMSRRINAYTLFLDFKIF